MNVMQKRILYILKESKKSQTSISNIATKLNSKNPIAIKAELDLLQKGGYVILHSVSNGNIKKAEITEKGRIYFFEGNQISSKSDVQKQLDDLKEAVELLNQALNAPTKEEKEELLTKLEKFQSILNGAYQVYENINKFL